MGHPPLRNGRGKQVAPTDGRAFLSGPPGACLANLDLNIDIEIPILTIVLGCLLLLVQILELPLPEVLRPEEKNQSE
ncbi:hypothetical protein THTE_2988 [Thermogutta terrifontis]|uniref:Uncharacterized protein n=1 Tax=Thermogutta terrifontis TaxID=1331910 RepID=A0A286RHZ1_9BACT|nr:hypothetical protein [Thermogutta terrifontis]ASV75590.1 hypothetical protein THTE_2988 [Thermogutta terrifontis]